MISEEQKFEITHEKIMNELDSTHERVKSIIEGSGLDINTTDLWNTFDTVKSQLEIMLENS